MTDDLQPRHRTRLAATAPFTLARSLRAMSGFAPCAGDQSVTGDRVRKAVPHPGRATEAVVVDVGPSDSGVDLIVHASGPLRADESAAVERTVADWLGLDDDLSGFLAIARGDPAMARVLPIVTGLHQVRFASLAEGAAYFALTQRSTQWYAAARKRRIAAELGPRGTVDGVLHVAFPTLDTLRGCGDLVEYAGNGQRAARLRQVLDGIAGLDEAWLRAAPYDEVRRALLAVPGIGTFTAHAVLLRVLGRPDDVPVEMAQFSRVAGALYGEPAPAPAELRERYGRWIGWWSYLTRMGLGWLAADSAPPAPGGGRRARPAGGAGQPARESSQRSRVRTPHPVAPLASSPSADSDQAGADMSRWAQRSLASPVNSRRKRAAISEPPPTSVELTTSATSLASDST